MRAAEKAKIKADLDKLFHECHEAGATVHGYAWLKMNALMVNAAVRCGVRPEDQPFKAMLSLCALKALNQMKFTDEQRTPGGSHGS